MREFETSKHMETNEITDTDQLKLRIREIIADELGFDVQEVAYSSRLVEDLNADSLDLIELVMRFEEEFDIEISDEDADKLAVVGDIDAYLERRTIATNI